MFVPLLNIHLPFFRGANLALANRGRTSISLSCGHTFITLTQKCLNTPVYMLFSTSFILDTYSKTGRIMVKHKKKVKIICLAITTTKWARMNRCTWWPLPSWKSKVTKARWLSLNWLIRFLFYQFPSIRWSIKWKRVGWWNTIPIKGLNLHLPGGSS